MTILVLLLLAIMWAAVLGPALFRKRAGGRSQDSIGAFRRQLGVLQRTGPNIVDPANSLRARAPIGSRVAVEAAGAQSGPGASRVSTAYSSPRAVQRRKTQQRRRDVLMVLSGLLAATLVLGAVPRLHVLWAATACLGVALLAYVALLVRVRNIAAEREMKLSYLPQPTAPEPALLLRRSAN